MITEKDVLVKARSLINRGWVKETFAKRDDSGSVCYCAIGALRRAAGGKLNITEEHVEFPEKAEEAFLKAEGALDRILGTFNIVSFNDDASTSKKDVLQAFDKAIEKVST